MAALPVDPSTAPPRVALYGGSFNPPHVGHVAVVAHLLATTDVDAVWVLPCPSHAFGKTLAPLAQRVAWCQAAFGVLAPDRIALCTVESRLPQPARSIDTLEHLRAQLPGTRFDLVVGADVLHERHAWKAWDRIEATTRLHVIGREGYPVPAPFRASPPLVSVSSTLIRRRRQAGLSVQGLVPAAVVPLLDSQEPLARPPQTALLGRGRLGGALARALEALEWPLETVWSRRDGPLPRQALERAQLVVLAVSDGAIAELADSALEPHHVALHLSGAHPSAILGERCRAGAACHPLQSFGPDAPAERFQGIHWGVEGHPDAREHADHLVLALDGTPFHVDGPEAKALYHAACCVISNGLVALADRAQALMAAAGVDGGLAALGPLAAGTVANLSRATRAPDVLTGPIARGDHAVVAMHREAIGRRVPEALPAYDALCLEIARTSGRR